jgi:hypothetical protein
MATAVRSYRLSTCWCLLLIVVIGSLPETMLRPNTNPPILLPEPLNALRLSLDLANGYSSEILPLIHLLVSFDLFCDLRFASFFFAAKVIKYKPGFLLDNHPGRLSNTMPIEHLE